MTAEKAERSDYTPAPQPTRNLNDIPGDEGLPLIGHTLEYFQLPSKFIKKYYQEYGPIYRCRPIFQTVVYALGPEANQFVLQDREGNFSSEQGWDWILGRFFTKGLMLRDSEDHHYQRRIMQAAFKKPVMQNYILEMAPAMQRGTESFPVDKTFLFYPAVRKVLLDIAAGVFLGIKLGKESDKVNEAFIDALRASMAIIRKPVPGLAYWKGIQGRRYLEKYFNKLIPEKRASDTPDLFCRLCHAESEDGEQYSDQEVVDHMIFLMLAAFDTTTSAVTTVMLGLAKQKEWQQRIREECSALRKDQLDYDDLEHLQVIEWVLNEALRFYPPVPEIPRRSIRECRFGEHKIPKNTAVVVSPRFTHRMTEYWREPDRFDPERFSPERAEHKQHPFLWVPFGGGAHKCLGLHFAYMQSKLFLFSLLQKYEISMAEDIETDYFDVPIPKPKNQLPIKLTPLN